MAQPFENEIAELRALGFAESVFQGPDKGDTPARLESGRVGVAVEFAAEGTSPRYAVRPLAPGAAPEQAMATDVWRDVVLDIHRRAPLSDDD